MDPVTQTTPVSIIIPAKNEAAVIGTVVAEIREILPAAEILVVNDGSSDDTANVATAAGARVISHPYSKGNGAAIKTGARAAANDIAVFMDADGQHKAADIPRLLARLGQGYDMIVGARSRESQASWARHMANGLYNRLASLMTGHTIEDLTSGFRAVKLAKFRKFLYLLPNGFSYPTTITMAFFREGFGVDYVPIECPRRVGDSHMHLLKDGARFFIIIFKVGTLYSPLKLFTPISALFFLIGLCYYAVTFITEGRFTNMGILLFVSSLFFFFLGLISEQISNLLYMKQDDE
ncbi:MAG: glycosyltransferase family 2 protein [Gammaproteobacteria bacterium]|nr:glycosyltransferase family 2 protein [Gammaproteobacteria bacterium]